MAPHLRADCRYDRLRPTCCLPSSLSGVGVRGLNCSYVHRLLLYI